MTTAPPHVPTAPKLPLATVVMAILLLVSSVTSLFVGVLELSLLQLLSFDPNTWELFLASRVPRLLACICCGVGMSVAGLIMQQLCMNKFVSPTTGATISSAQLGLLIALVWLPSWGLAGRTILAFVTSTLGTWAFVWFIQKVQVKDSALVPLIGLMMSYVISGITQFIAFEFEMNQALASWLVGHFSLVIRGRYELVWLALPLVILAFFFANHFNIVGMGKDFAKNLGVNYQRVLFLGLTLSSLLTASIVVTVGSISYIGLIVPNLVTLFQGDKIRGALANTALTGALFVLLADMLGRVIIYPYELPIELIVGITGSVVFVGMLIYKLQHGRTSPLARLQQRKAGRSWMHS